MVVPKLLTVREFEKLVFVAEIVNVFVTVRLLTKAFCKLVIPWTRTFPTKVESLLTLRSRVIVVDTTLRSPVTFEYPICY